MLWTNLITYGHAQAQAFEILCCSLFEKYCLREYSEKIEYITRVNGAGGDGGVEAFALLKTREVVALQTKWFYDSFSKNQIAQIQESLDTAIKVRPEITHYVVCIPRDLTSKRIVKGNKLSKKNQDQLWNDFICKNKKLYSNVEIVLWNNQRITEELANPDSRGLIQFWFDNSIILDDVVEISFKSAVHGWAAVKYIPELYSQGYIHNELDEFLLNPNIVARRIHLLNETLMQLGKLKIAYEDFERATLSSERTERINESVKADLNSIDKWIRKLQLVKPIIDNGGDFNNADFTSDAPVNDAVSVIKESALYHHYYFHFHEIEKISDRIDELLYDCSHLLSRPNNNKIVFLGGAGSGKTVAIVDEIDRYLKSNMHLPVLVHAPDFSTGDTWKTIIEKTLGLSNKWSEIELFRVLEESASLKDEEGFVSKCIICVDGIDESTAYDFWRNRIQEAEKYRSIFKRVRFVFLSRPYVFSLEDKISIGNCFSNLPTDGDIEVQNIFDRYVSHYNIDIGRNNWIKRVLRSPLSLKLFCDIYQNKCLNSIDKSNLVITKLCRAKINIAKHEYANRCRGNEDIFSDVLLSLAKLFYKEHELTLDAIHKGTQYIYTIETVRNVMSYIKQLGFVYSIVQEPECVLESPRESYCIGMQPLFEYLIAYELYDEIDKNNNIYGHYTIGVYQMLSVLLLENKGVLISCVDAVELDYNVALDATFFALANVPAEISAQHYSYLMKLMSESPLLFRRVFISVVLPCSKTPNNPLGGRLLDGFLRSFRKAADRDVWWSVPDVMRGYSKHSTYIPIDLKELPISDQDLYFDMPCVYAWTLTSVNNETRYQARVQLTAWGLSNTSEFIKLFLHFIAVNDMQLIEDIFAIAYGICLDYKVPDEFLLTIANWCNKKVFSKMGLVKYCNSAIRYYARGIIEITIGKGLLVDNNLNKYVPPYSANYKYPSLYRAALKSERMSGYGPIEYDLARYVLCDPLDVFFRKNYTTNKRSQEINKFISYYLEKYKLEKIKDSGLVLSIAFKYLLNCGWKKEYYDYSNKNNLGVDMAIRHTYNYATHGAQSSVMTLGEKYTWMFRHYFLALISDIAPIPDFNQQYNYLDNYNAFDSYPNTYQDLINALNTNKTHTWIHTDMIAKECVQEYSASGINQWIDKAPLPCFKDWIFNNNNQTLLYTFTDIRNEDFGIEETIWITSGLIDKKEYKLFNNLLNKDINLQSSICDPQIIINSMDGRMCTPQEACLVSGWKELTERAVDCDIHLKSLLTNILSSDHENIEKTFVMPSELSRELFEIKYGDGYSYYDHNDFLVAQYDEFGKSFENQQESLLVRSDIFRKSISKRKYIPFWLCRVHRDSTPKAKELFGSSLLDYYDKTIIVIDDTDGVKEIELVEPINLKDKTNISNDNKMFLDFVYGKYNTETDGNTDN